VSDALDQVDLLEKNLERQIEAIRASDIKITLLVPTLTGMLGFLAANLNRVAPGSPIVAYALLSAAPLILAYAFLALTVIPRMKSDSRSHLFFGGISRQSPEVYREAMRSFTRAAYVEELAGQCHATAMIARTKYGHVRNAYLAFFVALPFWATAIFLVNRGS
jgi:hypothetical protein